MRLADLPALRFASFSGTDLDDAALAIVCRATQLSALYLQDTRVTDEGLAALRSLTRLAVLRLKENHQLSDAALRHVLALRTLTELDLHETRITSRGLALLASPGVVEGLARLTVDRRQAQDLEVVRRISQARPDCEVLVKGIGVFVGGRLER